MGWAKGAKGTVAKGAAKTVWNPMAQKQAMAGKGGKGGKIVMVPMWMPAEKGKGKGKGKGKKGKGKEGLNGIPPSNKVWIGNLDSSVSWKDLKEHFDQAGKTKWVEPFTKGK